MNNPSGLKSIVVTGGTSGIGRGMVTALARPNHHLALLGRDPVGLARVVAEVESAGARATAVGCDLDDLRQVRQAATDIVDVCQGTELVALVNNAGVQQRSPTRSAQGVDTTYAVNYLAPLVLTDALVPHLARGATVVFLGSGTEDPDERSATRFGFRGARYLSAEDSAAARWAPGGSSVPGQDAYATSKLCCILLARQLAHETDPATVRFVTFDPGLIPGTGLARDVRGIQQILWRRVLPLLARVLPGWSTPRRAGRVVRDLLDGAETDVTSGTYIDYRGVPQPGSASSRDDALAARVVSEGRALVDRLLTASA